MVGEGDVLEDHPVVVLIEGRKTAILALHGEHPVSGTLHGFMLVAAVGVFDLA